MNYWLILIPLLSAFTGWITIKIVLKLLFRPLRPRKITGLTLQGVLPKYKQEIAVKFGQIAAKEFSSFSGLEQKISHPGSMEKIKPLIETHIDDFLRNKLTKQMPMIGMFIGDKTINTLKVIFMQEIETLFPQVMQQFAGNLKNDLDIEQLVVSKISAVSSEKIESILHKNLAKEFRMVAGLGVLIGLLIGLIQLAIILLTS
ncbi:MAG: DUF445 domain-containing protein [Chitinophagaceae bacterium]